MGSARFQQRRAGQNREAGLALAHGIEIYNPDGSFKTDFSHYMLRLIGVYRATEPGNFMFPAPLTEEPAVMALLENPATVIINPPGSTPSSVIESFDWELIMSGGLYTGLKVKTGTYTNTVTVFYVWAMRGTSVGQHGITIHHPNGDIVVDGEHKHPKLFVRNTYIAPSDRSADFFIPVPPGSAVIPFVDAERGDAATWLLNLDGHYGVNVSLGINAKATVAVYVA